MDGVDYIICVLQTMANDQIQPWKNITKRKYKAEKFKENIKQIYESLVKLIPDVVERFQQKQQRSPMEQMDQ